MPQSVPMNSICDSNHSPLLLLLLNLSRHAWPNHKSCSCRRPNPSVGKIDIGGQAVECGKPRVIWNKASHLFKNRTRHFLCLIQFLNRRFAIVAWHITSVITEL